MIAISLFVRPLLLVMNGLTVFQKSLLSTMPFFVISLKCFLIAFFQIAFFRKKERTERWTRLLKTQTVKGFGIEDSSSSSSSDIDSDDAANLGYNYRSLPTFEDSSGSGDEVDYFDTPEDNFFPVPTKYRLGPKRLLKLQQNMRTSSASRRFYSNFSNLGDDILKREGLMPTVTVNSTPDPIVLSDDDENISDADIDFRVDRQAGERHYTVDITSGDDDDDPLLFSIH